MRALNFDQNTPAWYDFRHQSIGASDIPILLGLSQYKKRSKLLHEKLEKTYSKKKSSPIAELGHQAESEMRDCVNENYKLNLIPLVVQMDDVNDLHASLDGIDRNKKLIWECKLTGKVHYEQIKNNSIPPHFYSQVQFQFYITKYKQCIFSAVKFNPKHKKDFSENTHKIIEKNEDFIKQIIIPTLRCFHVDLLKLKTKRQIEERKCP